MKKFLRKFLLAGLGFFLLLELGCRLLVDPFYFDNVNLYKTDKRYDLIFMGSSRVPATIDASIFAGQQLSCLVAGRGYTTGGIHLTALERRLEENPDYLRNSHVFIEYPGSVVFPENAEAYQYQVFEPAPPATDRPMPHIILPYLDAAGVGDFLRKSPNSGAVKTRLLALWLFASYRCVLMIQEKQPVEKLLKKVFAARSSGQKNKLAAEGGIKNNNFTPTRKKAIYYARKDSAELAQRPLLTAEVLDKSILSRIHQLVTSHGGFLHLYNVPLHSVQQQVTASRRAGENREIFERWLQQRGIDVVKADGFRSSDEDFPDTWHLSISRREDFSRLLAAELADRHLTPAAAKPVRQAVYQR